MNGLGTRASAKRILVLSFSQSGQLREIVDSLLAPIRENTAIEVVDEALKPVPPFPFPWSAYRFLDVFPESFREIPCPLEALNVDSAENFDLIIIAYQVWYLSPSIPVSSFLQSDEAKALLKNKAVVTIVGCRNMWYRAHERIKDYLRALDARLIGHIALTDRAFNLVSVITIVRWMLSGKKDHLFGVFPKPGVSEADIRRCSDFGAIIGRALLNPTAPGIRNCFNEANACRITPHLMALENAASRAFQIWSTLILRTARGSSSRKRLVALFGAYLVCGLAVLSPLSILLFYIALPFRRAAVLSQVHKVNQY